MSEIEDIGEIVEEESIETGLEVRIKIRKAIEVFKRHKMPFIFNTKELKVFIQSPDITKYILALIQDFDEYEEAFRRNAIKKIEGLEIENAELRKGLTRTRIDKCVKKHMTSDMSDMTKKEFPAVPCYEVKDCWLCNIYKEATDEQH